MIFFTGRMIWKIADFDPFLKTFPPIFIKQMMHILGLGIITCIVYELKWKKHEQILNFWKLMLKQYSDIHSMIYIVHIQDTGLKL